ncbi:hypothetical protein RDWZM_003412 [Blomia tropicalis]|uniref:Uncharacterized protein n=1 Tax=Blomia tropicalis TaxID=40697 RepID=A0A9Q0MI59_BLOTA|nr:hypothetical protein BLOT_000403 [Blomia tropicalis]KAJ6224867.1 hypothetical protein RDWZM_003412 [Blomia tropicalis]
MPKSNAPKQTSHDPPSCKSETSIGDEEADDEIDLEANREEQELVFDSHTPLNDPSLVIVEQLKSKDIVIAVHGSNSTKCGNHKQIKGKIESKSKGSKPN